MVILLVVAILCVATSILCMMLTDGSGFRGLSRLMGSSVLRVIWGVYSLKALCIKVQCFGEWKRVLVKDGP